MKAPQRVPLPPLVSIIIPVFNKAGLTMQCLAQLATVTKRIPHEVIVVDNASTDETPQLLKRASANVRVIRNTVNRGFACACNQGAAAASGKYLLFLNNDTIPREGWLESLVDELRQHPEVAAVGAKLIYASGLVQHAGVAFERESRNPYHPYRLLRADHPRVNYRRELQAVTAACVLIRPKWFHACKGFCEDYRNGYEDLDLCLKIRRRGGVIIYQPKSVVIHLESQTPGRMRHDNENRELFFNTWADSILSDEDAYYFSDGYRILGRPDQKMEQPQLLRLTSEAERTQWSSVARAQELAGERRRDELLRLLSDLSAWPLDGAVRRWAGALCLRLNAEQSAERHFDAALSLCDDPELRLLLTASGVEAKANRSVGQMPWEESSRSAIELLHTNDCSAAQEAIECALSHGGPPRLLLPALWQATVCNGSLELAELARQALLNFPPNCCSLALRLALGAQKEATLAGSASRVGSTPATPLATKGVSIIILALNQLEHTRKCLESVEAFTQMPYEIIVVDNGSNDGTSDFLKQWQATHSNCKVIRNSSNRGFAAGNNQALSIATGENLVLLNNDTVVTENWLEGLLQVLEQHPQTGIVGPMSNRVSGPQFTGEVSYNDLAEMPAFAREWAHAHQGQSMEIPRAVGFCLLMRRAVLDQIGGLDECFGSGNFEDDDLCVRARIAGFRIRIAQDVFIHHTGSQTFKHARINYREAMLRNWDLFRKKWQLPSTVTPETGYPVPNCLPHGVSLRFELPLLSGTHQQNAPRRWEEKSLAGSGPCQSRPVPGVARVGEIETARALLDKQEYAAAWQAAVKAVTDRPFHPHGLLLLAEIASGFGESAIAQHCAQVARGLAPDLKKSKPSAYKPAKGDGRPDWLKLPQFLQDAASNATPVQRVSVCIIARNEEKYLAQCLKSVQGLAHQIVVVDTGSTDATVEIAKSFGAEVHSFEWCDDFSAARNAALEHARGDWVLVLDADEELTPDQHARLRSDLKVRKHIALRLPLVNRSQEAEGRSYVPRLFRNAPGVYYTGRIHEQVFASLIALGKPWGLGTGLGTAELLHHGYTAEVVQDRNKVERNLNLLRLAVEETPEDANLRMNLGLETVRSGDLHGGLMQYRRAFELLTRKASDETSPELCEALLTQFTTQLYRTRAHDEVVQVLNSPLAKRRGLTASLHFALGLAYFELGKYSDAAGQMRQCLSKRNQPGLSPINTDIHSAAPHHCLAMSLARAGDTAAADKAFQSALTEKSRGPELRLDYARFLVEQNRPVDALHRLHELVAENAQCASAWRFGAQVALDRADFLEFACDWTKEAIQHLPQDREIAVQRAEALLLNQQTNEAREAWQSLCNNDPRPRCVAALLICELVEIGLITTSEAHEPEIGPISRAFIDWYRRMLSMRSHAVLKRVNERLEALRSVLPAAAAMIETAITEATPAPAPAPEPCLA